MGAVSVWRVVRPPCSVRVASGGVKWHADENEDDALRPGRIKVVGVCLFSFRFWFRGKFSGFFLLGLGVIRLACISAHE